MTICLTMIVKNEAHIIRDTLKNICDHINIDYWVISDTGSTDNTPEIIQHFFMEQKIDGELFYHEWKNFAHNRSLALECSFQKTDYVFIFDADDSLIGEIKLPLPLIYDRYMFKFGTSFSYVRPLLITNRKKWWFTGVLHEYLDAPNTEKRSTVTIEGNYHVHSGRSGARNLNPDKYKDDAHMLEKAIQDEPRKDLKSRYAYYCGQSYRDAHDNENAILWFKKCIDFNAWDQERFCAAYYIGEIYENTDFEQSQFWFCKTIQYDSERIEGIVRCVTQLYNKGNHVLVNALYHKYKDYQHNLQNKLFMSVTLYEYHLEFFNSISAYYANDLPSGYECCKRVILNCKDIDRVEKTIKNLVFYKAQYDKDQKLKSFIDMKKYQKTGK
jgi:glycosyltransferase involved in cell wall biosynthesis